MNLPDIKTIVKDKVCSFMYAKAGVLYYRTEVEGIMYEFPIDMNNKEDVGEGEFKSTEKSIYLMRWIRKSIDNNQFRKVN